MRSSRVRRVKGKARKSVKLSRKRGRSNKSRKYFKDRKNRTRRNRRRTGRMKGGSEGQTEVEQTQGQWISLPIEKNKREESKITGDYLTDLLNSLIQLVDDQGVNVDQIFIDEELKDIKEQFNKFNKVGKINDTHKRQIIKNFNKAANILNSSVELS